MEKRLEVLFTPADFEALARRDLGQSVCVVFDILRATSTMVTALARGAESIIPVREIADAVSVRRARPEVLLAGEREGLRIRSAQTGGVEFDLGNSPREFTAEKVRGRTIAMTTTNGTRALQACAGARAVLAGSFLNLRATVSRAMEIPAREILLVCSGTGERAAYEDVLGAGAFCAEIRALGCEVAAGDSAHLARQIFEAAAGDLGGAMLYSGNGRRLLDLADLRADVEFCLQRDCFGVVAEMVDGVVRRGGVKG